MNNQINIEKIQPTGIFTNYIFKAIPLAFDESMSYYECLCGLLNYLKNTVIPAVNNNGDAVIELQEKFAELKSFVDNYFDNLNVQDEVNNKLDEMVEDGTMDALLNTNLTGSLSDLNTTEKSNLVSAINEVNTGVGTNASNIGDLSSLGTTEKSNLVGAINEVNTDVGTNTSNIGDLTSLDTTEKSSLVSAINEVNTGVGTNTSNIGVLSNLDTTEKSNIVGAINEVNQSNIYSTDEVIIGKWLNKPLYRKSFYFTEWTGLGYDTGLTDIENIINSSVMLKNTDNQQWMKFSKNDGDFTYYIKLSAGSYKILIQNDSVYTADAVCCYIEYTKSTT